ncbi:MAG TPA: hypothetical protein VFE18_19970 [Phenylobacterium sp.]|jgi:hypothetical protein|uniref:hypothetical protein n=1 Tax=Phenylobacterium sp. TaxID=1871053 RepID=UPI002D49F5EE|nr:hypothetical protein [Phenylobacterium sp.]HZZ70454.1 hypothetical protein [Phenylobacterium sp.]
MKLFVLAGLAGAVLAFGADAQPQAQSTAPKSCFLMRNLRNHTIGVPTSIYLNVDGVNVYRVTTDKACLAGATSTEGIVIRPFGSGQVCGKQDLDISVRGAHCIIEGVSKMTPAEVAALPRRLQP